MSRIRLGLGQIAPRLGALRDNLELHRRLLAEARSQQLDLVVFPELGLTGYLVQDLNAELAIRRDDPLLEELAGETVGLSAVVGFIEESAEHQLYIAAALLEDGRLRDVVRKSYLPNYGLFDERRFFAQADQLRALDSQRLGVRLGISICEDFWHLPLPYLLALDGAEVLINIASSPGRDVAAIVEGGLGTADAWRPLLRTYAMLTTCFVIYVNRVGVEEAVTFWGGSEVIDPGGTSLFRAPLHDEGLFACQVDTAELRRIRLGLPLLRDERPGFVGRQLERILRERAGQAPEPAAAQAVEQATSPPAGPAGAPLTSE